MITINVSLSFNSVLILGSIMGVQFGQKISEKVDSSEFKAILAILLLLGIYFLIRFKNRNKLGRWIFSNLIYLDLF